MFHFSEDRLKGDTSMKSSIIIFSFVIFHFVTAQNAGDSIVLLQRVKKETQNEIEVNDDNHNSPSGLIDSRDPSFGRPILTESEPIFRNPQPVEVSPIVDERVKPIEREVIRQCPIGTVLEGSQCVDPHSNDCPHGFIWRNNRCVSSQTSCPLNFDWDGTSCTQRKICPNTHVWRDDRCVLITPVCPSGWDWNGSICEIREIQCPPGSVRKGNECVLDSFTCPEGYIKSSTGCVKPHQTCPPGYTFSSGFCVNSRQWCPPGSVMVDNQCRITVVKCPEGTYKVGERCYKNPASVKPTERYIIEPTQVPQPTRVVPRDEPLSIVAPTERYIIEPTQVPQPTRVVPRDEPLSIVAPTERYIIETKPVPQPTRVVSRDEPLSMATPTERYIIEPKPVPQPTRVVSRVVPLSIPIVTQTPPITTSSADRLVCPEGYTLHNDKLCYKCSHNYNLCNSQCIHKERPCTEFCTNRQSCPNAPSNSPSTINVNLRTDNYGSSQPASGKGYNIINDIGGMNNTIININNVTNPVALNNVNENNIHIYTSTKCPDGSIRTVTVMNNETVSGCIEAKNEDSGEVVTRKKKHRCCEIVTPRQCSSRQDEWSCSHKRYKYCGNFCIADRLYLKPPTTTYRNNILTFAPQQYYPYVNLNHGHSMDCSGCMNGSWDCSAECYTYPCNHNGGRCNYLDQSDFCGTVGGRGCH